MRILGFCKKWDKLSGGAFTTFRLPRRDRDWVKGEHVQVVLKPRSKEREILGEAVIIAKDHFWIDEINNLMAIIDGFNNAQDMRGWLLKSHNPTRLDHEPLNRLLVAWCSNNST